MPSRNVENRDRGRREWVGGRFCPPLHVMEGGPYRPQITMWLELPEPLVVACHVEDPKEQTTFAQTLREAMRRPLAGPPRRPGRVRVSDALQAAELRAAMPDLEVAVAPTPELELLGRDLAEHLLESTPEKDTESYLEGGRIPAPAVARLFEAARLLYVVAPWKTASDDQILRVDIPQLGIEGACLSIIGALGQNLGFILFPSLEGFEAFQQLCQKEPKAEGPLDLGTTILSLNFERGADLPPSMRREVAEHGWQVAGPRACPRIDHLERDGLRRPLTEHDLRVVSAVATSLGAFFVKHGSLARAETDPICESWAGNDGLTVRFTAPYDAAHHFAENAPRPVAASPKVGRNQPCPCGSGKKYKKCCLPASEAHAATPSPAPVHERDQDLVAQMRRYAKRRFGEAWARAASDFADAAQSVQLFGPWSVYVFEVEGRPIVGWFLEECGARLDAAEREWLLAQQRAWLSVWEVLAVEPGKSVTMRDLLSGEQRRVHEVRGSAVLVVRDAILGRVVDHQGISVFCGIHPRPLPPFEAAEVLRRARSKLRRQSAVPVEKLRQEPFGRFLIARWEEAVEEMDARTSVPPQLRNTDGEELLFTTDHFSLEPGVRAEVEARLRALEGAQPPEEGGEDCFSFLRSGNAMHKDWENTVIARAWVSEGALKLESNSIARADELRRRIEEACTGLLRHRAREHSDPVALAEHSPPSEPEDELPPEVQQRLVRDLKERHYADWPDQPLPALGGKTPRDAARTRRGRAQVDLLLRQFEHSEGRLPPGERFDISDLRAQLRLQK